MWNIKWRTIVYFLPIVISICVTAQVTPTTQIQPNATTQTLINPPSAYTTIPLNQIREWQAVKPYTDDNDFISSLRNINEVKQNVKYFDGLGKLLQTVSKNQSPDGYDVVHANLYDNFGREAYSYLPYTSPGTNGNFKNNPFAEQNSFLNDIYNPNDDPNGEKFFYGKTEFENSPLNRPIKTLASGNSWAGSNKGLTIQYLTNNYADEVKMWKIDFDLIDYDITPSSNGGTTYADNELLKIVTTDEHGKKSIEYKNKNDQVILKKIQISDNTSMYAYSGWLCTYYVYDNLGQLRFVIPPKAVAWLLGHGWNFDNAHWSLSPIAKELCFSYEYDNRSRPKIKRVPGAGQTWMVYDIRDRVVMTQDEKQRVEGKWFYIQYDEKNRPIVTGIWSDSHDMDFHQNKAKARDNYPNETQLGTNSEILSETYYDDYSWVTSNINLGDKLNTTYITDPAYFLQASNNTYPYPQKIKATKQTTGLVTGTKVKVLGTSTYLYSATFYDEMGRVIQVQSTNYSGGTDYVTTQYGFDGKVLRRFLYHEKNKIFHTTDHNGQPIDLITTTAYKLLTKLEYDDYGRLTIIKKKLDDNTETTIAEMEYDEQGELKTKELGKKRDQANTQNYTNADLETLEYNYNIRGWLTGINKNYAKKIENTSWFGIEISYDYGFTQNQYNGNIAGIKWRSKGDGEQRAYGFSYDPSNRIKQADFRQAAGSLWDLSAGIDFSMPSISYDENGNILSMKQNGLKLNSSDEIDNLSYHYLNNENSNRLQYVTDQKNDLSSQLGDFKEITSNTPSNNVDYTYDQNGSMITDANKDISITYNHINLPTIISVTGKGVITYTYDASGNKLKKTVLDNTTNPSKTTVTEYYGPFVYENDDLQFITHEEGRLRLRDISGSTETDYDYFIKDHLGNVRMVLTDELQKTIYPVATLENNSYNGGTAINTEDDYYTINPGAIVPKSLATGISTYPNNNGNPPYNNNPYSDATANNDKLYRLNGNGVKTGLGITLKVMSGDVIDIFGKSYYFQNNTTSTNNNIPVEDIILGLLSTPTGVTSGKGASLGLLNIPSGTVIPNSFLNKSFVQGDVVPKAYINWILFDEQFKYVKSGYSRVGNNSTVKDHFTDLQGISINKNGYVYVYCSNESIVDVFFDNLQVIHTRGPLVEETHYYPFGLTMAGINSKALNFAGPENKKQKFQGQELAHEEFSDGSGLEMYEFKWRMDDPQIGRFWQIDPLADKYSYNSMYAFSENKVTSHIELEGLESVPTVGTAGIDGKYPVQGDCNGDGIVDASESKAWLGAVGVYLGLGATVLSMGRINPSGWVSLLYNPALQVEIIGGLAGIAGYEGPELPGAGSIVAKRTKVIFNAGAESVTLTMQKGSAFADAAERMMAQQLLSEGQDVVKVVEGSGPTGDFLVGAKKIATEFKKVSNITSNDAQRAIKKLIEEAFTQASSVIINVKEQKGVTEEFMKTTMERVIGNNKTKNFTVRIIGDGFDFTQTHIAEK